MTSLSDSAKTLWDYEVDNSEHSSHFFNLRHNKSSMKIVGRIQKTYFLEKKCLETIIFNNKNFFYT